MIIYDKHGNPVLADKKSVQKTLDLLQQKSSTNTSQADMQEKLEELPQVPKNKLDWSLQVRTTIDGRTNILNYIPMLRQLHDDDWNWIMYLFARQMTKSSLLATEMAYLMTNSPNKKAVYCTFEDEALSVFSNEKWRDALWDESPIAHQFVIGSTTGAVGYIKLKNNSSARLVTHANKFHHVESKSADLLIFDEGQNLDLDEWVTASESQSFTNGKFRIAGIGGWADTEYHKWWKSTDQRIWKYNNELWREKLEFNADGLVWDSYMLDVLSGYWKQTVQENQSRHGYFANQYDAPWIPLKKSDCEKYKLPINKSIQWKEENYPQADFIRHVQAGMVEGEIKPFTTTMLHKLYNKNLSILKPSEVDHSLGPLVFGADWGGGNRTVRWIYQILNKEWPVLRMINADKIPTSDVTEQYDLCKEWIDDYDVAQAVIDAGGGTYQVQQLQKRYGRKCVRFNYLTRPEDPHPSRAEEKTCRKENRMLRDKTFVMERTKTYITQPYLEGTTYHNRIIWPAKDAEKLDWIVEQFTNEMTERIKHGGKGTYYTSYFTPDKDKKPDDALHANNYAIEAAEMIRNIGSGHTGGAAFGESPDSSSNSSFFADRHKVDRYHDL
jgi:hypothetical protein